MKEIKFKKKKKQIVEITATCFHQKQKFHVKNTRSLTRDHHVYSEKKVRNVVGFVLIYVLDLHFASIIFERILQHAGLQKLRALILSITQNLEHVTILQN